MQRIKHIKRQKVAFSGAKGMIGFGKFKLAGRAFKGAKKLYRFAKPKNYTPKGAGRRGAFRVAKRDYGIPMSQQPTSVNNPAKGGRGENLPGRDTHLVKQRNQVKNPKLLEIILADTGLKTILRKIEMLILMVERVVIMTTNRRLAW
ncbi:hypothetical protein [Listeria grandensis]|uniref:hypothetical protein n=1 Tax=Listeria grandensis TaxID=1494963 RepID=UPI0021AB71E7|nr:hypothetical protein [Listeria grandensis]